MYAYYSFLLLVSNDQFSLAIIGTKRDGKSPALSVSYATRSFLSKPLLVRIFAAFTITSTNWLLYSALLHKPAEETAGRIPLAVRFHCLFGQFFVFF